MKRTKWEKFLYILVAVTLLVTNINIPVYATEMTEPDQLISEELSESEEEITDEEDGTYPGEQEAEKEIESETDDVREKQEERQETRNLTDYMEQVTLSLDKWWHQTAEGEKAQIEPELTEENNLPIQLYDLSKTEETNLSEAGFDFAFSFEKNREDRDIIVGDYIEVVFPSWFADLSVIAIDGQAASLVRNAQEYNDVASYFDYSLERQIDNTYKLKIIFNQIPEEDSVTGRIHLKFSLEEDSELSQQGSCLFVLQQNEEEVTDREKIVQYRVTVWKDENVEMEETALQEKRASYFNILNRYVEVDSPIGINGYTTCENYTNDSTQAQVTITWNDNNDFAGSRPEYSAVWFKEHVSISYELYEVEAVISENGDISFSDKIENQAPISSGNITGLEKYAVDVQEESSLSSWNLRFTEGQNPEEESSVLPKYVVGTDEEGNTHYYLVEYEAALKDSVDSYLDQTSAYRAGKDSTYDRNLFLTYAITFSTTVEWKDNTDAYATRPSTDEYENLIIIYGVRAGIKLSDLPLSTAVYNPDVTASDPNLTITDNGDNTYTVTYDNLPQYNLIGAKMIYCAQQKEITDLAVDFNQDEIADVTARYGTGNSNAANNYTNITEYVFSGGTVTNTLNASTQLVFEHAWKDDNAAAEDREGKSVIYLYRTAEDEEHNVILNDSPVSGYNSINTPDANGGDEGDLAPENPDYYRFYYNGTFTDKDGNVFTTNEAPVFDPNGARYVYYIREVANSGYQTEIISQGNLYDGIQITGDQYILNGGTYISRLEDSTIITAAKEFRISSIQEINRNIVDSSVTLALEYKYTNYDGDTWKYMDARVTGNTLMFDGFDNVVYVYDEAQNAWTLMESHDGWPGMLLVEGDTLITISNETVNDVEVTKKTVFAQKMTDETGEYYRRVIVMDSFTAEALSNRTEVAVPAYDADGRSLSYRWVEIAVKVLEGEITADPKELDGLYDQLLIPRSEKGDVGPGIGNENTTAKIKSTIAEDGTIINTLVGDINVTASKVWENYSDTKEDVSSTVVLYRDGFAMTWDNKEQFGDSVVVDDINQVLYVKTSYYNEELTLEENIADGNALPTTIVLNASADDFSGNENNYRANKYYTWLYLPRYNEYGAEYVYTINETQGSAGYQLYGITYRNEVTVVENPDGTSEEEMAILDETATIENVKLGSGTGRNVYRFHYYLEKEWLDDSDLECRKDVVLDVVYIGDDTDNYYMTYGNNEIHALHQGDVVASYTLNEACHWRAVASVVVKKNENYQSDDDYYKDYVIVERSINGELSSNAEDMAEGHELDEETECSNPQYNLDTLTKAGIVKKLDITGKYVRNEAKNLYDTEGNTLLGKVDAAATDQELIDQYRVGTIGNHDEDQTVSHFYNVYNGWYKMASADKDYMHYVSYDQRTGTAYLSVTKKWYDGGQGLNAEFAVFRGKGTFGGEIEQLDATVLKKSEMETDEGMLQVEEDQTGILDDSVDYDRVLMKRPEDENVSAIMTWKTDAYDKFDKYGVVYNYFVRETKLISDELSDEKVEYDLCNENHLGVDGIPLTELIISGNDGHSYAIKVENGETIYSTDHYSGDVYQYTITNTHAQKYNLSVNVVWRDNGENSHVTSYSTENGESGNLEIGANNGIARPDISVNLYQTTLSKMKDYLKNFDPDAYAKYESGDVTNEEILDFLQLADDDTLQSLLNETAATLYTPQQRVWNTTTGSDWWWTCDFGEVDRYTDQGESYIYFATENLKGNASNYDTIYYNSVKTYSNSAGAEKGEDGNSLDYRPSGSAILVEYDTNGNIESETLADRTPGTTSESFIPMPEVDSDGNYLPSGTWDRNDENWSSHIVILSDGGNETVTADTSAEEYSKYFSATIVNYIFGNQGFHGNKVWKLSNGNEIENKNLPDIDLKLYVSYREGLISVEELEKDGALADSITAKSANDYVFSFPSSDINEDSYVSMKLNGISYHVSMYAEQNGRQVLPRYDEWGRRLYYYVMEDTESQLFNTNYDAPKELTSGDFTIINTYKINPEQEAQYAAISLTKHWEGDYYRENNAKTTFLLYAQWQDVDGSRIVGTEELISEIYLGGRDESVIFDTVTEEDCSLYVPGEITKIPFYAPNGEPYLFTVIEITPDGFVSYIGTTGSDGGRDTADDTDKAVTTFAASYEGVLTYNQDTDKYFFLDKEGNHVEYTGAVTDDGMAKISYDGDNKQYYYEDIDGDQLTFTGDVKCNYIGENTLVNEFCPPSQTITIDKIWSDYNNRMNTRPDGITYDIVATMKDIVIFTMSVQVKKNEQGKIEAEIIEVIPQEDYQSHFMDLEGNPYFTIADEIGAEGEEQTKMTMCSREYMPGVSVQNTSYEDGMWEIVLEDLPTFTPSSDGFTYTISERTADNQRLTEYYESTESQNVISSESVDKKITFTNKIKTGKLTMDKKILLKDQNNDLIPVTADNEAEFENLINIGAVPETLSFAVQYSLDEGSTWNYLPWDEEGEFVIADGEAVLGSTLQTRELIKNHTLSWEPPIGAVLDNVGVIPSWRVVEIGTDNIFEVTITYSKDGVEITGGVQFDGSEYDSSSSSYGIKETASSTVENALSVLSLEIQKEWKDKNNQDDTRPAYINLTVTDDLGNEITYTLTNDDSIVDDSNIYTTGVFYVPFPTGEELAGKTLIEYLNGKYILSESVNQGDDDAQEHLNLYELDGFKIGILGSDILAEKYTLGTTDFEKTENNIYRAVMSNILIDKESEQYEPKMVTLDAAKLFRGDKNWSSIVRPDGENSKVFFELYYRKTGDSVWTPVSTLIGDGRVELEHPSSKRDTNFPADQDAVKMIPSSDLTKDEFHVSWDVYKYWWQVKGEPESTDLIPMEYAVQEVVRDQDGNILYQSHFQTIGNGETENESGDVNRTAYLSSADGEGGEFAEDPENTSRQNVLITNAMDTTSVAIKKDWGRYVDVNAALEGARVYQYSDGYAYQGTLEVDGTDITGYYRISDYADMEILQKAILDDFARYLGALYRTDRGVTEIVYNGCSYTWNLNGTLKGSNWEDANGNTLVSVIAAAYVSDPSAVIMLGIHGIEYSLKAVVTDTIPESTEEPKISDASGSYSSYGFSVEDIQWLINQNVLPEKLLFELQYKIEGETEWKTNDSEQSKIINTIDLAAGTIFWDNLPVKDKNGKEITYKILEISGIYKNGTIYTPKDTTVKGSSEEGYLFENAIDLRSLEVTKIWKDEDDRTGIRGDVTIRLLRDGSTYLDVRTDFADTDFYSIKKTGNTWTVIFKNLPYYKNGSLTDVSVYQVQEIDEEGKVVSDSAYKATYNGYADSVITNTYVPERFILTATKEWDDSSANDSSYITQRINEVELSLYYRLEGEDTWKLVKHADLSELDDDLYSDGGVYTTSEVTQIVSASVDGGETVTWSTANWENLPEKVNGFGRIRKVYYQAQETRTVDGKTEAFKIPGYTPVYSNAANDEGRGGSSVTEAGYICEDSPVKIASQTVINTLDMIDITLAKVWKGDTAYKGIERPVTVTFEIERKTDADETWSKLDTKDGVCVNGIVTISGTKNSDTWTRTIQNLPRYDGDGNEYEYRIREVSLQYDGGGVISLDEDSSYQSYTVDSDYEKDQNGNVSATFTNTLTTTQYQVTKIWDDDGNRDNTRKSIKVSLLRDGTVIDTKTLTAASNKTEDSNKWSYTWKNLPLYQDDGVTESVYTVKEETSLNGYTTTIRYSESEDIGQAEIINFLTPTTFTLYGSKNWQDDYDNIYRTRGEVTATLQYKVGSSNTWKNVEKLALEDRSAEITEGYSNTVAYTSSDVEQIITNEDGTLNQAVWKDLSAYAIDANGKTAKVFYRIEEKYTDEEKAVCYYQSASTTANYGTSDQVSVTNTLISVDIEKIDPEGNLITETETTFDVYIKDDANESGWRKITGETGVTTTGGKLTLSRENLTESLKTDSIYKLVETNPPEGYEISKDIIFKVVSNAQVEILEKDNLILPDTYSEPSHTIPVTNRKSTISLQKVDLDNNSIDEARRGYAQFKVEPLNGAHFADGSDDAITGVTSDNIADKLTGQLVAGMRYKFTEIKAPDGYELINKDGNSEGTAEALSFTVEMEINGTLSLISSNKEYVDITKDSDHNSVITAANRAIELTLRKYGEDYETSLNGAEFILTNYVEGKKLADGITESITLIISENGQVAIPKGMVASGQKYRLTEGKSPDGYQCDVSVIFEVEEDGTIIVVEETGGFSDGASVTTADVVKDSSQDDTILRITNEKIRVSLKKLDYKDHAPLAGVKFRLTPAEGSAFAELTDVKFVTLTTGSDGTVAFPEGLLIVGHTYVLTETATLDHYKLYGTEADRQMTFTVQPDGSLVMDPERTNATAQKMYKISAGTGDSADGVVDVTAVNEKISLIITKVDGTHTGTSLAGAVLKLTKKDENSGAFESRTILTTTEGTLIDGLPKGIYKLEEISAPDGYRNGEDITFTISETGKVTVTSTGDNAYLISEGTGSAVGSASLAMKDAKISFGLVKKNADTGAVIDQNVFGVPRFTVTPVDDSHFADMTTVPLLNQRISDLTGKLVEGNSYWFEETEAPKGYELAVAFTVKVSDDGHSLEVIDGREVASFEDGTIVLEDTPIEASIRKEDIYGRLIAADADVISTAARFTLTPKQGSVFADGRTSVTLVTVSEGETKGTVQIPSAILVANNSYILTEITAPDSYEIAEPVEFIVDADGTLLFKDVESDDFTDSNGDIVTVQDELIDVKISKTFTDWTDQALSKDAIFRITCADGSTFADTISGNKAKDSGIVYEGGTAVAGEVLLKVTADESGTVVISVPEGVLKQGQTYLLEEIETATGYQLDTAKNSVKFTVKEDGTIIIPSGENSNFAMFAVDSDKKDTMDVTNVRIQFAVRKTAVETTEEYTLHDVQLTLERVDERGEAVTGDEAYSTTWPQTEEEPRATELKNFSGLSAGWYKLTETNRPAGFLQAEPMYLKVNQDNTVNLGTFNAENKLQATDESSDLITRNDDGNYVISMRNVLIRGHVSLTKVFTGDGSKPVQDAVFKLYRQMGAVPDPEHDQVIAEGLRTDSSGKWSSLDAFDEGLTVGSYYFMETDCASAYLTTEALNKTYTFEIRDVSNESPDGDHYDKTGTVVIVDGDKDNGTAQDPITNIPYEAKVELLKTEDAQHNYAAIDGATFDLYYRGPFDTDYGNADSASGFTKMNTTALVTDTEGMISVKLDRKGEYRFVETGNKGYVVENSTLETTTLRFVLTDVQYSQNGENIWHLKQTSDTVLDEEPRNVVNEAVSDGVKNIRHPGSVELKKVDSDNTNIVLKDVEFTLFKRDAVGNATGDALGVYVTGEDGKLAIKNLDWGSYILVETKTNPGYKLGPKIVFDINRDNVDTGSPTYSFTSSDSVVKNEQNVVVIQKRDEDGSDIDQIIKREEAIFKVYKAEDVDEDGSVKEDAISVASGKTENGNLIIKGQLTGGESYVLVETKAPNGYELSEQVPFTIDKNGVVTLTDGKVCPSSATITSANPVDENNYIEIRDTKIAVNLKKTDLDAFHLSGEKFSVTGTFATKKDSDFKDKTLSELETALTGELVAGEEYTFVETTAPEGYELTTVKIKVQKDGTLTVSEGFSDKTALDGSGTKLTIKDTPIEISLKKVGEDALSKGLAGAEYTLSGVFAGETDVETITLSATSDKGIVNLPSAKLVAGYSYTVSETKAPDGYELGADVTFTVNADGTVTLAQSVMNAEVVILDVDGTVNESGDIVGIQIIDNQISIKINKTNLKNNQIKCLSGAEFTVEGKFTDTTILPGTDKKNIIVRGTEEISELTGKLIAGETYRFTETKAPEGYEVADVPLSFCIYVKSDGTYQLIASDDSKVYVIDQVAEIDLSGGLSKDTVIVYNEPIEISLKKVDVDNPDSGLKGAVYSIKGVFAGEDEEETRFMTASTENGIVTIPSAILVAGHEYTLHEVTAPDGYEIGTDVIFAVKANGTVLLRDVDHPGATVKLTEDGTVDDSAGTIVGIQLTDKAIDGTIIKVDADNRDIRLTGAKFTLTPEEGSAFAKTPTEGVINDNTITLATDTDGVIRIQKGILKQGNTYVLKEIKTMEGYYLSNAARAGIVLLVNTDGSLSFDDNSTHEPYVIIEDSVKDSTITVSNKKSTTFTIKKNVTGNMGDLDGSFDITLTVKEEDGTVGKDKNGVSLIKTITMKRDESLSSTDIFGPDAIPVGATLVVKEPEDLGYTPIVTVKDDIISADKITWDAATGIATVVLDSTENIEITLINHKDVVIDVGVGSDAETPLALLALLIPAIWLTWRYRRKKRGGEN